ncbi:MAG: peptide chain release factor 2 [Patescibacteria group bacterium]|jgi:peptide chain release factor 2
MDDLVKRIEQLKQTLSIDQKQIRVDQLNVELQNGDVWQNPDEASQMSQELADLKNQIDQWQTVYEMVMAGDSSDREYLENQLHELELVTYLNQPHDSADAILSVHAGTGGVEAMDWALMLLRMYLRYAEKKGWRVETLEKTDAEEAGIKSATIRIKTANAYGFMRGEAGVHRLVRLSPFNAQHLRQTSFALVEVVPEIIKTKLDIPDKDLRIDVYRASGHGGQGVNTTDSAVRITHIPTNIVVTCQNERSQMQNKESAMRILQSRLLLMMEKEDATELNKLKPQVQGSWGNQIRSYVMQPYTMVKDHRTEVETSDVGAVLDGDLDRFIQAELVLQ